MAGENLQARIRGTVLMALSNRLGGFVLTAGNKSEMATGYATLYGADMTGAFAVIKDIPKMLVYALARDRNERAGRALIPEVVLDKPPSAELRPDQKDSDSLPDYAMLDPIVEGYVQGDLSIAELDGAGFRRRHGAPGGASHRPQRVQAPAGTPRSPGVAEGVRQGSASAHHQPLARLGRSPADAPRAVRGRGRARARRPALRHHVPARPRRARGHHAVRVPRRPLRHRGALRGAGGVDRGAGHAGSPPALARRGSIAGLLLFGGYATQTVGLQYTSASTSAFVTGLYVVLTPVVEAVVYRRVPGRAVWAGIVLATIGLYLLTGADIHLGRGELLTLACAVLFAGHIVYIGAYVRRVPPAAFTGVQLGMVAVLSVPAAAGQGIGTLTALAVFAVVFTGIACSAIALPLQLWGQRRIPPARAALILLAEPVFAGVAGFRQR